MCISYNYHSKLRKSANLVFEQNSYTKMKIAHSESFIYDTELIM